MCIAPEMSSDQGRCFDYGSESGSRNLEALKTLKTSILSSALSVMFLIDKSELLRAGVIACRL